VTEFGTNLTRLGLRRTRGAIVTDDARRRAAAAVVTVSGGLQGIVAVVVLVVMVVFVVMLPVSFVVPPPCAGAGARPIALRCSPTIFSSKTSASRSSIVIAPSGHSPRQAPRPSHKFSATSLALPSMSWIAPSAQLGTQSPQPLHFSASINTILRFMSVSSRRPWRLHSQFRSDSTLKVHPGSGRVFDLGQIQVGRVFFQP